jgi:hypothetical protein
MGPRKKKPHTKSKDGPVAEPTIQPTDHQLQPISDVGDEELVFAREYWTGASRDGVLEDGDGYHYYRMTKSGKIIEAYECYELDDGRECAAPLPEMLNVNWIKDLGFEDFEALDMIKEIEFSRIKDIAFGIDPS